MKAAVVNAAGQQPVYADFDEPAMKPGHRVVKVEASALSQLARGKASGQHYSSTNQWPIVAGVDGVGHLEDGDARVYFFGPAAPFGAMAERTLVAEAHCIAMPAALDAVTAAAIAIPGMSSWAALNERAGFVKGETVWINGATGASGRLAVQIARALGAGKIIATGRNEAVLESLGADVVFRLDDDEAAMSRRFQPVFEQGVDVVLDYVWGPSARALLIAAAKASSTSSTSDTSASQRALRFVQIGSMSGAEIALPAAVLRSSAITLMGSGIGSIAFPKLLDAVTSVLDAAARGSLSIDTRPVPLSRLSDHWADEGGRLRTVFLTRE